VGKGTGIREIVMDHIHSVITDAYILQHGFVFRDGFCFTAGSQSNIYDALVIKNPLNCTRWSPKKPSSSRTLSEHIELIQQYALDRAVIIADDFTFLKQCPSLRYITLYIGDEAEDHVDLSSLYDMPHIECLRCRLMYGGSKEAKRTTLDCSKIQGLRQLVADGPGFTGYGQIPTMECLKIIEDHLHKDASNISISNMMKKLSFQKCGIKTLNGLSGFSNLQQLNLSNLRCLSDMSAIVTVADTLRALSIEACPKIVDFSFLNNLRNLEHLNLMGNNMLPNLEFINAMPRLKTFVFSMQVQDCDLTPCTNIPYISVLKGKKRYNLKDSDLPKNMPSEPFVLR
jgi:hypothetical protein